MYRIPWECDGSDSPDGAAFQGILDCASNYPGIQTANPSDKSFRLGIGSLYQEHRLQEAEPIEQSMCDDWSFVVETFDQSLEPDTNGDRSISSVLTQNLTALAESEI